MELAEQLLLCRALHDWDSVANLYERLQRQHPDDFRYPLNRSSALWKADRPVEAFDCARQALRLAPGEALAWRGLGSVLKDLGRFEEADQAYKRSLLLRYDPETIWNRAQNLMGLEKYAEAFALAEARLEFKDPEPYRPGPYWSGWPEAESVTVWSEQGFGDVIQYLRWLPALAGSGRRITLELEPPLIPLVKEGMAWCLPSGTRIIPKAPEPGPLAEVGCHGSLLSLPSLLGGEPGGAVAAKTPYLRSPRWNPSSATRRRVGLVWAAGEQKDNAYLVREYRKRTLPPSILRQVLHGLLVRDLGIVSMQIGPDRERLPSWAGEFIAVLPPVVDFAMTADLCSKLDLVISVDTATAHLCGAMGMDAWILLPWASDSRWQRNKHHTVWYPSLRLLRQPAPGDWQGLLRLFLARLDLWCADQEVLKRGPHNSALLASD